MINKSSRTRMRWLVGWMLICLIATTNIEAKEAAFIEQEPVVYGNDTVHTYVHAESGLRVLWIENEDPNKSFTLGVKTPTTDSTGVNHIIEHTVFTGSKSYPSSTLFFDASSQYPSLFMNAMTTSDLTLYPFATLYDESYLKLMSIYLDSILNPNMLESPYSFYEESFYYDPERAQTGGVVYNEMKGASTNPDRMLFRTLRKGFYEGTHYENDSGGEVSAIPTLSYEQFKETYYNYYYPGNMMITLYGDIPLQQTLEMIDHYFEGRPLSDKQVDVNVQTGPIPVEQTLTYDAKSGEHYLVKAFRFKESPTAEQELHMDLWLKAYVMGKDTPFTNALDAAGIGQVHFVKDGDLEKPMYAFVVPGGKTELKLVSQAFDRCFDTLKTLEEDVTREEDVLAREKMRFQDKDEDLLRGLAIAQDYIDEWSHAKPSHRYYETLGHLQAMTDIADCGMFMMQHMDQSLMLIEPSGEAPSDTPLESMVVEKEDWAAIVASMSEWQQATKHQPLEEIALKDLTIEPEQVPEVKVSNEVTYMLTERETQACPVYRLYLPTATVEQQDLPYLFLYAHLIDYAADELKPYQGEVDTQLMAIQEEGGYTPYLKVTLRPMTNEDPRILWDRVQMALQEQSDKWYKGAINKWTMQFHEQLQTDILGTLKMFSLNSQTDAKRYMYETGYPLYVFSKALHDTGYEEAIAGIKEMKERIFFTDKAGIGIVAPKDTLLEEQKAWEAYVVQHKLDQVAYQTYALPQNTKTNMYYKDSPVDYLICSYDKGEDTIEGSDYVMASYLTHYYLQPKIRVEKGAYGAGMYAVYPDSMMIYTYRDPDFKSSLALIEEMGERITVEDAKVRAVKVDALGQMQKQFKLSDTPSEQIAMQEKLMLGGIASHDVMKLQKNIVQTGTHTLQQKLDELKDCMKQSHMSICTKNK